MINYNRLWTLISEYNLTKTEFMNQLFYNLLIKK